MSTSYYVDALALQGLTLDTPSETLTPKQKEHVAWCKRYALSQARNDARMRRLREHEFGQEEFMAMLDSELTAIEIANADAESMEPVASWPTAEEKPKPCWFEDPSKEAKWLRSIAEAKAKWPL